MVFALPGLIGAVNMLQQKAAKRAVWLSRKRDAPASNSDSDPHSCSLFEAWDSSDRDQVVEPALQSSVAANLLALLRCVQFLCTIGSGCLPPAGPSLNPTLCSES